MTDHLKKALSYIPDAKQNARKLKAVLMDIVPDQRANINLFTITVTSGVVEEIAAHQNSETQKHVQIRWIKKLTNEWAIDRQKAHWAVECWCEVFEIEYIIQWETESKDDEKTTENQLIFEDNETGLMWQDDKAAKEVEKDWEEAKEYCKNLTLGGYTDWRLPTLEELSSIVDHKNRPTVKNGFKNTIEGYYWTSSSYSGGNVLAWYISFGIGSSHYGRKSYNACVRCVRSKR